MEDQNAKELHEPGSLPSENNDPLFEGEDEGEELSATDRILYVVTSPKRAFQGLLSAPLGGTIGLGFVVSLIIAIGAVALIYGNAPLFKQQKQLQVEGIQKFMDKNPDMPEQQREEMEKQIVDVEEASSAQAIQQGIITTILGYGLLLLLVVALVIWAIAKILERGRETRIRYSHSLAIAALAMVAFSLGGLITALVQVIAGDVKVYLGAIAFVEPASILGTFVLMFLSVPMLWWIGIIGTGIGSITERGAIRGILWFGGIVLAILVLIGVVADLLLGLM